ncbi:MAG TPA: LysR family transcriptional regulator [Chryseolinea sp.]|nr:LysR family transcriptional regulator [Chryseolinea sp.]
MLVRGRMRYDQFQKIKMELKYFRLIVFIAAEGSLTKAAEKLCLTQSALSHQLKELEDYLGFAVFYRINKKLRPTPHGHHLIKDGRRILIEVNKTMASVALQQPRSFGALNILVECYSSFFWLPKILNEFRNRYPNTEIAVDSSLSHDYTDDLIGDAYDIALVINKKPHDELEFCEVLRDRLVVAMSNKNPLVKSISVGFEALRDQTIVTHCKPDEIREMFEHIVPPKSFKPYKVIQVTATEGIIDLVDEALGVAVISEWIAKKYCSGRDISLRPFDNVQCERYWYLARKKRSDVNPPIDYFVELMKSTIGAPADHLPLCITAQPSHTSAMMGY